MPELPITILSERPEDLTAIQALHDEAFDSPGEGQLVNLLRENGQLSLSLVALLDDQVIGHIAFSPVAVVANSDPPYEIALSLNGLAIAPVAVLPKYQNQGAGRAIINHGLEFCKADDDIGFLVVLGAPSYYSQFGFSRADESFGLGNEYNCGPEFMGMELQPQALVQARDTTLRYASAFKESAV